MENVYRFLVLAQLGLVVAAICLLSTRVVQMNESIAGSLGDISISCVIEEASL